MTVVAGGDDHRRDLGIGEDGFGVARRYLESRRLGAVLGAGAALRRQGLEADAADGTDGR